MTCIIKRFILIPIATTAVTWVYVRRLTDPKNWDWNWSEKR